MPGILLCSRQSGRSKPDNDGYGQTGPHKATFPSTLVYVMAVDRKHPRYRGAEQTSPVGTDLASVPTGDESSAFSQVRRSRILELCRNRTEEFTRRGHEQVVVVIPAHTRGTIDTTDIVLVEQVGDTECRLDVLRETDLAEVIAAVEVRGPVSRNLLVIM